MLGCVAFGPPHTMYYVHQTTAHMHTHACASELSTSTLDDDSRMRVHAREPAACACTRSAGESGKKSCRYLSALLNITMRAPNSAVRERVSSSSSSSHLVCRCTQTPGWAHQSAKMGCIICLLNTLVRWHTRTPIYISQVYSLVSTHTHTHPSLYFVQVGFSQRKYVQR